MASRYSFWTQVVCVSEKLTQISKSGYIDTSVNRYPSHMPSCRRQRAKAKASGPDTTTRARRAALITFTTQRLEHKFKITPALVPFMCGYAVWSSVTTRQKCLKTAYNNEFRDRSPRNVYAHFAHKTIRISGAPGENFSRKVRKWEWKLWMFWTRHSLLYKIEMLNLSYVILRNVTYAWRFCLKS